MYDLGGVEVPESPHEEGVLRKARFGAFEHPGHNKHRLHSSHPPVVVILPNTREGGVGRKVVNMVALDRAIRLILLR